MGSKPSPLDGPDDSRTLISIVDDTAAADPSRPVIFAPRSSDPKDGWKPITYEGMANAINHVAGQLLSAAREAEPDGQSSTRDEFPTVAYIGPNDSRYLIFLLACIKAGHKAFFISPRNSPEGQLSLFRAARATALYHAASYRKTIQPWLRDYHMPAIEVPELSAWIEAQAVSVPYTRTFEQARWDPLVVVHTSGSTGIPKPIVVRQGSAYIGAALIEGPDYMGATPVWRHLSQSSTKMFSPMPLFHGAAIAIFMLATLLGGTPLALGIPDRPLGADLVVECLQLTGADAAFLPPSLLEEMGATEEGVAVLSKLSYVGFGGGNMAPEAGTKLIQGGVKLINAISSTENFPYALHLQTDPELWQYFIFNSETMGADWRPVPWQDDVYELFFVRNDAVDPMLQPIFYTFPELTEWSTGDLFQSHPTLKDHWLYRGRADNVIVFSNGEKLNPTSIEAAVMGHPAIKGALVAGQDKFQAMLILESVRPIEDAAGAQALIDEVWPTIEEANKETVAHGRIARSLVTVADNNRPFLRAGKGTVQRGQTLRAYADFINETYKRVDAESEHTAITFDLTDKEALTHSIIELVAEKTGIEKSSINPETDFFGIGVDSLQVMSIAKLLRSTLEAAGLGAHLVAGRDIYANPTPKLLAGHLFSLAGRNGHEEGASETKALEDMIAKYTADLPEANADQAEPLYEGQTVLLTGTTGSLGAYALDQLCSNARVTRIIALNRGDDGGQSRQHSINLDRDLSTDFSKVEFLGVDLSKPRFGLEESKYAELLETADRVLHNAWPVNFNMSLASFEPYVRGVRHLADFSHAAKKRVPIVFVSSIGTVGQWSTEGAVPETQLTDLLLPTMGYGQSKLVGSLILDAASKKSGVPSASIRVGQIAGSSSASDKGVWNRHEFLPSLIVSSVYLGLLPENLGSQNIVAWSPVESIAGLLLDIAGVTTKVPASEISGYFHGVNPAEIAWSDLIPTIQEASGGRIKKLVSFEQWVRALETSADATSDIEQNPAIKLLDTYRGMLSSKQITYAMERTKKYSPTMANQGPMTTDWMKKWYKQWDIRG